VRAVGALVPAAGLGVRLGPGIPKALRLLAGEPLLVHAIRGLRESPQVGPIIVAAPAGEEDDIRDLLADFDVVVVTGGRHRHDSVSAALAALPPEIGLVLVHDAARCLTPPVVVGAVVSALRAGAEAVVPALPLADTVKRVVVDRVVETVPRAHLRAAQTPQGFRRDVLLAAHQGPGDHGHTDDAGMVEALGRPVTVVPGHEEAFKVTGPFDMVLAEAVLAARARA
jgi:2-C-methyl-D-erythritol 4-phosphate cytidylyltransferase